MPQNWKLYRNNLKKRFLTALAFLQNLCLHSSLASRQWSLAPDKNSEKPPCQSPAFLNCFGIFIFLLCVLFITSCGSKKKASGYQIGIDPTWAQLELAGQENNVLAFSIDLLVEIAKQEKLELSIVNMSWDNLVWGLDKKKYDAILSSMYPYTFYLKQYSFSDSYLMTGPILVVPKASIISQIQEIQGKEIAVVKGSSATLLLQKYPGVLLRSYDSAALALEATENRNVNGAVISVLIGQKYLRDLYREELKAVTTPLTDQGLRLITLFQQDAHLRESFNRGLHTLKKRGSYEKLLEKWGLSPDGEPVEDNKVRAFLKSFF